jgi:hypothetical protein
MFGGPRVGTGLGLGSRRMGRKTRLFALLTAMGALTFAPAAAACSCEWTGRSTDLAKELRNARESGDAIYLARAISIHYEMPDPQASLLVEEAFAGQVKAAQVIRLQAGGFGDCTPTYDVGPLYLIYAADTAGSTVLLCSRTRKVEADDPELRWLRTGQLPPIPVAVQREVISCERCDALTQGNLLVGRPAQCCKTDQSFGGGIPPTFLASGFETVEKSGVSVVGRLNGGRAFRLTQSERKGVDDGCRTRVWRQWCEGLEPVSSPEWNVLPVRCLRPGEPIQLCDEGKTQRSSAEPLESLSVATCQWSGTSKAECTLIKERRPLAIDAPRRPLLRCAPRRPGSDTHECEVLVN